MNTLDSLVLIQGAMQSEISFLLENLKESRYVEIDGFPFYRGVLDGSPVVVSKTFSGKVNASLATVLGIRSFSPTYVLNQGTAGAHKPEYNVGDIIIGERYIDYDSTRTLQTKEKGEGYSFTNQRIKSHVYNGREWEGLSELKPTSHLLDAAVSVPFTTGKKYKGTIATGDGYNKEYDAITDLKQTFSSDCEEMETFAVAHICRHYSTPFLGIRVISNNELRNIPFDSSSCEVCQRFCLDVIRTINDTDHRFKGAP